MLTQPSADRQLPQSIPADCSVASPSFLAGWHFLSFVASADDDALPMQCVMSSEGPSVVFHPASCPQHLLEDPKAAFLWLPLVLQQVAEGILREASAAADGIGAYAGDRWAAFRSHSARAMGMGWPEIVAASRRDGVPSAAAYMVESLFVEDGIQLSLARRACGQPALHAV